MTVETNDTVDRWTISGTGPYVYSFRIFDESELTVHVDTGELDPTLLTLNTHYTVSGVDDEDGGTITLTSDAATEYAGDTLDIRSNTVEYQPTSIRNQGRFLPEIHEDAFDRLNRQIQDLSRRVDRKFGYPDNIALDGAMVLRSSWADKWVYVNEDGELEPALAISTQALSQSIIGDLLYPRTAAEIAASVTPTNYFYPQGDVRRYGAALDGSTDDTAALQRWASVGGDLTFSVPQTALITAAVELESNSRIEFVAGARVETATQNISLFFADTKTNIKIRGGHFKQTSAGNNAYTGGVTLTGCSYCEVTGCEFEGMQWAGVFLDSSSNCIIENNYSHDFLASSAGDKADICVYRNSSFNTIQNNRCYGGSNADHGILVQDPGGIGTYLPRYNKVIANQITDHASYGIVFYIGGSQQGNNQCIGNTIQNITGTALSGASGTGIYCVGNGLGTMLVDGNLVRNCCISTTSAANGPGGISINDTVGTGSRVVCTNNTVEEMSQGHGILISTLAGGAVVTGNTVRMPSSNDGTGDGGATLAGNGIRVINSNNVSVAGNQVLHDGPQDAIFVYASSGDHKNISVVENGCVTSAGCPIRFGRDSTLTHTNVTIAGNTGETTSNTPNVIQVTGVDRCAITGNAGGCGNQPAIAITSCTNTRIANNVMNTTGSVAVSTNGTCTGSFYDRSNQIPGTFNNGGTGCIFEKLLTGSATYDPPGLNDGIGGTTTVTVTGAVPGDRAVATFSNDLSGLILHAWVSSADTVSVRFQNETGGTLDLASGTLRAYVIKN